MADGLLNIPIFVRHGDVDQSVNVDYSRWGVRLLQRWGYDARYRELPGRGHEALENQNSNLSIEWFLQHRRNSNPRHVRLRSAELRNASAYWVHVLQSASPLAFMVVDAEIVDQNVIRLDAENILDIELSPSAALVDQTKPVKVVWNGSAQEVRFQKGKLHLTAASYKPAPLHKNERLPGSINDFTVTPFALVIGTSSTDTEMVSLCRQKAAAFIKSWQEWQKHSPRVFIDTAISDIDAAKYSLLLIGGANVNRITAKLAARLPLQISADSVIIDSHNISAKDAAVQMIYPNPFNPERYVWIAASTSTDGMYFNELNPQRLYDWDYVIADGHFPAFQQKASALQTRVVSGMFDSNWRFSDMLTQFGDADIRAKGRLRRRPNENLAVSQDLIDSYVGRYQIMQGPLIEIIKDGKHLRAKVPGSGGSGGEMVPESETNFTIPAFNVWMSFVRDSSGKVTGFIGYQDSDFEGKRLN